jgi:hypothetical protein
MSSYSVRFTVQYRYPTFRDILEQDKARSLSLLAAQTKSIDVTNATVSYTASVGVGSPAQDFTLLIDTGKDNMKNSAPTTSHP